MKAVELFAGIGGFRLASDRTGLHTIWANDISAKACTVYKDQFGDGELQEGELANLEEGIPAHEVLTAGFPCQPFSSAGKKAGIRDVRGTLFEHIVDILKRHRPKYFVLENVKRLLTMERGWHFATILEALAQLDYAVEWRLLNAVHFGLPQNRERVFIVGQKGSDGWPNSRMKDGTWPVRLAVANDLSCLDDEGRSRLFDVESWGKITDHRARFANWGLAYSRRFFGANLSEFTCASAPITLSSVLEESVSDVFDFTETTAKWVGCNRPVNRLVNGVEIISNQKGGARMGYTIFGINGVAPTLTSTTSRHYERYKVGDRYRRLTNVEYARIQGFPDDYCCAVSVYDQYSLYGNAVPPPMAEWVIRRLAATGISSSELTRRSGIMTLFDHAG